MKKVIFYTTDQGKEPFIEWLEDLEIKSRQIINTRIARLRLGNFGDCKIIKGSQTRDIAKAKRYWQNYQEENK